MKPSDQDVRTFLKDEMFPAERVRLVADAMDAGAPDGLVESLRSLPGDRLFASVTEVVEALRPTTEVQ